MGRHKSVAYATKDNAKHFIHYVQREGRNIRDMGLKRIRRTSGGHLAEYHEQQGVWVFSSGDWFLGYMDGQNHVFLNVMDKSTRALMDSWLNTNLLATGLGTTWACDWYSTSTAPMFTGCYDIETHTLGSEPMSMIQMLLKDTELKLYTYSKLSDTRVIYLNLATTAKSTAMEKVAGVGEFSRAMAASRSDYFYLLDKDAPESYKRENFMVLHERDMNVFAHYDSHIMLHVSLAGLQRLYECETPEEFVGVLNTNIGRKLKPESAYARYNDIKNIIRMSGIGITPAEAFETLRNAKKGSDD